MVPRRVEGPDVAIAVEDDVALATAFRALKLFRENGLSAEMVATGSPRKRFDKAAKMGAKVVVGLRLDGDAPVFSTRAATDAMFLLLDHAFALGHRRVAWKCNALNAESRRAAERLGFSLDGVLRAHMIVRGRRRDSAYYSLLADEWPARRAALRDWLDPANFDAEGRARESLRRAA